MGDSCFFEMTVLDKDRARINKIMFGDEDILWSEEEVCSDKENEIQLREYEANYAYFEQREKLAKAGINFYGNNEPGGNYGAFVFACYNGKHVETYAIEDSQPIAVVNINGDVDETSLKNAREYYQTLDLVKKHFEAKDINANS